MFLSYKTCGALGAGLLGMAFICSTARADSINYPAGFPSNPPDLTHNGSAQFTNSLLQMTDGGGGEAGSVFSTTALNITSFTTTFTLKDTPVIGSADGVAFVIQDAPQGDAALGPPGGALGYAGIANSIALKFALFTNGGNTSSTGLFTDGQSPDGFPAQNVPLSPINLASGDPLTITLTYNGTTLNELVTDTVTAATFSDSYSVNIPGIVGGSTAFVGFTGSTGAETAIQDIQTWTYNSAAVPEPSTLALLSLGGMCLVSYRWRQRRLSGTKE